MAGVITDSNQRTTRQDLYLESRVIAGPRVNHSTKVTYFDNLEENVCIYSNWTAKKKRKGKREEGR